MRLDFRMSESSGQSLSDPDQTLSGRESTKGSLPLFCALFYSPNTLGVDYVPYRKHDIRVVTAIYHFILVACFLVIDGLLLIYKQG